MSNQNKISLMCDICKTKNYRVNKSVSERLIINKFCKNCSKHTEHKEEK